MPPTERINGGGLTRAQVLRLVARALPRNVGNTRILVLRPGATPNSQDVFDNWMDLYAVALPLAQEGAVVVLVDSSLSVPVVPPGSYDLRGFRFLGRDYSLSGLSTLRFADGVEWTGLPSYVEGVEFIFEQSSNPVYIFNDLDVFICGPRTRLRNEGTNVAFATPLSSGNSLLILEDDTLIATTGTPILEVRDGWTQALFVRNAQSVSPQSIGGLGIVTWILFTHSPGVYVNQTAHAGSVNVDTGNGNTINLACNSGLNGGAQGFLPPGLGPLVPVSAPGAGGYVRTRWSHISRFVIHHETESADGVSLQYELLVNGAVQATFTLLDTDPFGVFFPDLDLFPILTDSSQTRAIDVRVTIPPTLTLPMRKAVATITGI